MCYLCLYCFEHIILKNLDILGIVEHYHFFDYLCYKRNK